MAKQFNRSVGVSRFINSTNGRAIMRRLCAMARYYFTPFADKLDPNWYGLEIHFKSTEGSELIDSESLSEVRSLELDHAPREVVLVGPTIGEKLIEDHVFKIIPEPLVALIRTMAEFGTYLPTILNPKHTIELIDGKTAIYFESGASAVVRNVRGDMFDLELLEPTGTVFDFTRSRLRKELKLDPELYARGQACSISYFPLRPWEGQSMNTVEEYREGTRIVFAACAERRRQEEVKKQAREAAQEAALSPEERAKRQRLRERSAAQAGIIRELASVLPQAE